MKYRPYIDGLRALAVIPVVIFHLGSNLMPGGYVGVDVFFVISGYLITNILISDIEASRYSLMEFYKRRALRILPALFAVVAFTLLMSSFLLLPAEQRELGASIVATSSFLSNFYFWSVSDYFSAPAESAPLLHTWSLAVEEQFYIFFPILLLFLSKYSKKHIPHTIALLSLASFTLCLFLTKLHQETAFYLLPTRAWELGIGATLAIWAYKKPTAKRSSFALSAAGLALILTPVFLLEKNSEFPGWNALYPTVGTALLIGWANGTTVGRFLSTPPMIWIGKISYSFYLWHWPLIVFWRLEFGHDLSGLEAIFLFSLSIVLAALSTNFIEKPFRSMRLRQSSAKHPVAIAAVALTTMAALGFLAFQNHFSLVPLPSDIKKTADTIDYRERPEFEAQFRKGLCYIGVEHNGFEHFASDPCTKLDSFKPNVLLIGDSHAAQYWGPFSKVFPEVNFMQANSSGCRPLPGSQGAKRCTDLRDWIFDDFLQTNRVDAVVIGGRWEEEDLSFIPNTIRQLKTLTNTVIMIGPTVEYQGSLPTLLARSQLKGRSFNFTEHLTPGRDKINIAIREMAKNEEITYIDVLSKLCNGEKCILFAPDDVLMQFDYGHLTFSGAELVVRQHKKAISKVLESPMAE